MKKEVKSYPPNWRDATCCYECIHSHQESYYGCDGDFACKKYEIETSETDVCDDFESKEKK